MNFILTTEKEISIKHLLRHFNYKFLDVEEVYEDFINTNPDIQESDFKDLHFSNLILRKFQNHLKTLKSQYFVYRVPVITNEIYENLMSIINEKYLDKFKKCLILTSDIEDIYNEIDNISNVELIEFYPDLETI